MYKLTRYVAITVLNTTFIVCAGIMGIFLIITFISQTGDIGKGNFSTLDALLYALYEVPLNLYLILPMSSLLGCLMGLGVLANNSELIVMRSAGLSILQISRGVMLAGVIITLVCFVLGAFAGPYFSKRAEISKTMSTSDNNAVILDSSAIWLKDKNAFIEVGKSTVDGKLYDIKRYTVNNSKLTDITFAEKARYQKDNWQISNVTTHKIKQESFTTNKQATQEWETLIPPSLIKVVGSDTKNLTLPSLWSYIEYNERNDQNTDALYLKFWQMIFQPLSVMILIMIAVPFVFGPMRSSAMGFKAFLGLMLGFVFFIVNQFFGPFTQVYGIPPFVGAALPVVVFSGVLVILFWKARE